MPRKPHGKTRALKNFLPGGLCSPDKEQASIDAVRRANAAAIHREGEEHLLKKEKTK